MSTKLIHYIFGSIIGLLAWAIPYTLVNTPVAESLSTAIATYCEQPQDDRMELQTSVAMLLVKGDSIEIHCASDKPISPKKRPLTIVNGEVTQ